MIRMHIVRIAYMGLAFAMLPIAPASAHVAAPSFMDPRLFWKWVLGLWGAGVLILIAWALVREMRPFRSGKGRRDGDAG